MFYEKELAALKRSGRYRERRVFDENLIDLASNDYLGLSKHPLLQQLGPEPLAGALETDCVFNQIINSPWSTLPSLPASAAPRSPSARFHSVRSKYPLRFMSYRLINCCATWAIC